MRDSGCKACFNIWENGTGGWFLQVLAQVDFTEQVMQGMGGSAQNGA